MRFLHPALLPWLWLAVVPVVLYLFRRKSRTVRVSTLLFFKSLAREHQESAALRRLKRWLSLLLTLLLVCGPVLALARLVVSPGGGSARSIVVVLDRSASMAATDASGVARLDAAKNWLRTQLAGVPESTPVALVASDARPQVVQSKTTNRREFWRALDTVAVRPVAEDAAAALASAEAIAALETPAEIWWLSDADAPSAPPAKDGVTRQFIFFALPDPLNAGITAFSVQKIPLLPSRYQAYAQVALNPGAKEPQKIVLEPRVAGVPLARRELTVAPGETQGVVLELDAAQEQVLEVSLEMPGDGLEADNHVAVRLPAPRPLVVAWFTPKADPFTQLALQSLAQEGEVEIFTGGPAQWPPARLPDVAIFDGWLPEAWPENQPAIVINPPRSLGPVHAVPLAAPVPREAVRPIEDEHPLLFRVSTTRLALTQTAALDSGGALRPLWVADNQAVLLAGENAGQRLVVMGFAPALSPQLPLTPSYPLLLGNALYWCAEKSDARRAPRLLPSGALVEDIGSAIEWREWHDGRLSGPVSLPVSGAKVAELDRLGLWKNANGTREGSSALLSFQETSLGALAPPSEPATDGVAEAAEAATTAAAPSQAANPPAERPAWLGGEMTRWFIALIVMTLLLESWLYHRHAVN